MTALREAEVAGLSVGEIDLMSGRITLRGSRTKNRRPHRVPIHPLLIAELQGIWPDRKAGADNKLLGAIKGSAFAGFSGPKRRLDEKLPREVQAWRWHDLRRSARSAMSRLGVLAAACGGCLEPHIQPIRARTDLRSPRASRTEAIAALQAWQQHVGELGHSERAGRLAPGRDQSGIGLGNTGRRERRKLRAGPIANPRRHPLATTGSSLPQPIAVSPAEWPTLRTVVEARLPSGFFDRRPPYVLVVAGA